MSGPVVFDVVVVGAGPAGCAAAICLSENGLKIGLIDKYYFPREKICGDALSKDALSQIRKISESLHQAILAHPNAIESAKIRIQTPNRKSYSFHLQGILENRIMPRAETDMTLLEECRKHSDISIMEGTQILNYSENEDSVILETNSQKITASFVIAGDGANSLFMSRLNSERIPKYITCVRGYYKGISGCDPDHSIELHYLKALLPGYLWIFPLKGDCYNVGIGITEKRLKRKRIVLSKLFDQVIAQTPDLAVRFSNAEKTGQLKAWRIPAFTGKVKRYSRRVLLAGDAAFVVDVLSGEGVGNALRTGWYAAEQALQCFKTGNFTEEHNRAYELRIRKEMQPEIRMHKRIVGLIRFPFVLNFALGSARITRFLKRKITGNS
ncbi:MAG: geranylgeranyl reductase family protein [Bacteroidetes bacterium]|nr:geranylgeranyl reductase family protein [Bacteroidota bacterium]MBU1717536.1 geranylgeranyl reductase family protein [Bacteroidota bacterium]